MIKRQRLTQPNSGKDRLKKLQKLEKLYEGWKEDFTLHFCFTGFIMAQYERKNSAATIYNYECFIRRFSRFLEEKFDGVQPDGVSVEILTEPLIQMLFSGYLKKQGLQDSSVMAFLRNYRAFGRWCVEEGYLEFFECTVKNVPTKTKEVYTPEELAKLMVKPPITDFHSFRSYCMISLMLNTGARRKTIANIRICDLEVEEGFINFNVTKSGKVVRLGLERKTRRDLVEWLNYWRLSKGAEPTDYLFCNEFGEQISCNSITYSIGKYNKEHGVEKTSVHLFRHTFAKMWITSGGDIITLARVLTHSELEMVQRYANLYGGDIKKEIQEHSAIAQLKQKSGKTLKSQKGAEE